MTKPNMPYLAQRALALPVVTALGALFAPAASAATYNKAQPIVQNYLYAGLGVGGSVNFDTSATSLYNGQPIANQYISNGDDRSKSMFLRATIGVAQLRNNLYLAGEGALDFYLSSNNFRASGSPQLSGPNYSLDTFGNRDLVNGLSGIGMALTGKVGYAVVNNPDVKVIGYLLGGYVGRIYGDSPTVINSNNFSGSGSFLNNILSNSFAYDEQITQSGLAQLAGTQVSMSALQIAPAKDVPGAVFVTPAGIVATPDATSSNGSWVWMYGPGESIVTTYTPTVGDNLSGAPVNGVPARPGVTVDSNGATAGLQLNSKPIAASSVFPQFAANNITVNSDGSMIVKPGTYTVQEGDDADLIAAYPVGTTITTWLGANGKPVDQDPNAAGFQLDNGDRTLAQLLQSANLLIPFDLGKKPDDNTIERPEVTNTLIGKEQIAPGEGIPGAVFVTPAGVVDTPDATSSNGSWVWAYNVDGSIAVNYKPTAGDNLSTVAVSPAPVGPATLSVDSTNADGLLLNSATIAATVAPGPNVAGSVYVNSTTNAVAAPGSADGQWVWAFTDTGVLSTVLFGKPGYPANGTDLAAPNVANNNLTVDSDNAAANVQLATNARPTQIAPAAGVMGAVFVTPEGVVATPDATSSNGSWVWLYNDSFTIASTVNGSTYTPGTNLAAPAKPAVTTAIPGKPTVDTSTDVGLQTNNGNLNGSMAFSVYLAYMDALASELGGTFQTWWVAQRPVEVYEQTSSQLNTWNEAFYNNMTLATGNPDVANAVAPTAPTVVAPVLAAGVVAPIYGLIPAAGVPGAVFVTPEGVVATPDATASNGSWVWMYDANGVINVTAKPAIGDNLLGEATPGKPTVSTAGISMNIGQLVIKLAPAEGVPGAVFVTPAGVVATPDGTSSNGSWVWMYKPDGTIDINAAIPAVDTNLSGSGTVLKPTVDKDTAVVGLDLYSGSQAVTVAPGPNVPGAVFVTPAGVVATPDATASNGSWVWMYNAAGAIDVNAAKPGVGTDLSGNAVAGVVAVKPTYTLDSSSITAGTNLGSGAEERPMVPGEGVPGAVFVTPAGVVATPDATASNGSWVWMMYSNGSIAVDVTPPTSGNLSEETSVNPDNITVDINNTSLGTSGEPFEVNVDKTPIPVTPSESTPGAIEVDPVTNQPVATSGTGQWVWVYDNTGAVVTAEIVDEILNNNLSLVPLAENAVAGVTAVSAKPTVDSVAGGTLQLNSTATSITLGSATPADASNPLPGTAYVDADGVVVTPNATSTNGSWVWMYDQAGNVAINAVVKPGDNLSDAASVVTLPTVDSSATAGLQLGTTEQSITLAAPGPNMNGSVYVNAEGIVLDPATDTTGTWVWLFNQNDFPVFNQKPAVGDNLSSQTGLTVNIGTLLLTNSAQEVTLSPEQGVPGAVYVTPQGELADPATNTGLWVWAYGTDGKVDGSIIYGNDKYQALTGANLVIAATADKPTVDSSAAANLQLNVNPAAVMLTPKEGVPGAAYVNLVTGVTMDPATDNVNNPNGHWVWVYGADGKVDTDFNFAATTLGTDLSGTATAGGVTVNTGTSVAPAFTSTALTPAQAWAAYLDASEIFAANNATGANAAWATWWNDQQSTYAQQSFEYALYQQYLASVTTTTATDTGFSVKPPAPTGEAPTNVIPMPTDVVQPVLIGDYDAATAVELQSFITAMSTFAATQSEEYQTWWNAEKEVAQWYYEDQINVDANALANAGAIMNAINITFNLGSGVNPVAIDVVAQGALAQISNDDLTAAFNGNPLGLLFLNPQTNPSGNTTGGYINTRHGFEFGVGMSVRFKFCECFIEGSAPLYMGTGVFTPSARGLGGIRFNI